MIPHRNLQRSNNNQASQNDRIGLQQDFGRNEGSLGMNLSSMQHQGFDGGTDNNSALSQQFRLFQANQDLLLTARREHEGLSLARQTLNGPQRTLQNNLPSQLFSNIGGLHGMRGLLGGLQGSLSGSLHGTQGSLEGNLHGALHSILPAAGLQGSFQGGIHGGLRGMGAKSNNTDALISEAFQRGKEEVIRSLLQSHGPNAINMTLPNFQLEQSQLMQEKQATLISAPKDPNARVLNTLGTTSIERRKKNAPYFDASSLADPAEDMLQNRRTRGGVTEPFPEKLHRMLLEVEKNDQEDILSFHPHGRSFAIHDPDRFCKEVMPSYFKQSRLSSFQRQLNLYGFTRITNGPDAGGYYHELFLKGRPSLAIHMRRVGVTQATSTQRSIRPTGITPDFYSMPAVKGDSTKTEPKKASKVARGV